MQSIRWDRIMKEIKMDDYEIRVSMVYEVVSHAVDLFKDDYSAEEFTNIDSLSDTLKRIVEDLVEADEYYKSIANISCSSPDSVNIVMKFDFNTLEDYYIKVIVPIHTTYTLGDTYETMIGETTKPQYGTKKAELVF